MIDVAALIVIWACSISIALLAATFSIYLMVQIYQTLRNWYK